MYVNTPPDRRPVCSSSLLSNPVPLRIVRVWFRSAAMACALLAILLVTASASATASTYTVNVTTDSAPTTGGSGSGTSGDLRYVLTQAESAGNSGSTIQFSVTGTITLAAALPAISQSTMITGPTSGAGITISGSNAYSVFTISSGTVNLSNLTIENGNPAATAGAS